MANSFIFQSSPLLTSRYSANKYSRMCYRLLQIFLNHFSQHARHRHVNPSDARASHIVRLSLRATQSHLVKFRFFAHKAIDENLFRHGKQIGIQRCDTIRITTSRRGHKAGDSFSEDHCEHCQHLFYINFKVKAYNGREEQQTKRSRAKLTQTSHLDHFHLVEMPKVNFYFRHEKIGFLQRLHSYYNILKHC